MTAPAVNDQSAAAQVHIGRQPIYHGDRVYAYELLFRSHADARIASSRGASATGTIIHNAFAEFGLESLVGPRRCFINVTREYLTGQLPMPFEPGQVILEVLETVHVDDEVVASVIRLVESGFDVALDDFVIGSDHERLLDVASYVKIDLASAPESVLRPEVARLRERGLTLVAERVETEEDVAYAQDLGFHLMQGYALGRPQTLSMRTLGISQTRRLELFGALSAADLDLPRVVSLISTDPALALRVLQATNSAQTGLKRRVSSLNEAVTMLGVNRIRQWVSLMVLTDVTGVDQETLSGLVTRARLCQTVTDSLGGPGESGFMVGLVAGIADLMKEDVQDVVRRLPLDMSVAAALVEYDGVLGHALQSVRAYENWTTTPYVGGLNDRLAEAHLAAMVWSNRLVAEQAG
ncbi:EAL and modified HD-GYP domain-containing signal transduction protein [Nocardioides terrae]|uniref:EAL and modified HD-GYP domain-containing signal transduction protein n=1 Tax=Nocardioides terrae TaxID=574651 RepID=A0A1I1KDN0_9ACTN|nr:HDOD domain-containing protein [Nocardioides terrae]SFC58896.1 EAL and modified HD-GYP domain-containing signal transduction protein [Nocardioides terrae]